MRSKWKTYTLFEKYHPHPPYHPLAVVSRPARQPLDHRTGIFEFRLRDGESVVLPDVPREGLPQLRA